MSEQSPEVVRVPRRPPRAIVALCVALGLVALCWSVLAPLGEAPDEPAHLALVLHLAEGNGYPAYDGLQNQRAIIRLCRTYAASTRACPREGEVVTTTSMRLHPREEAPDKGARPAWDDEGGGERTGQINQMPQHPPLYYQAMAAVLRVERAVLGGPWSADRELALLRVVNALLLAPLPWIAWWGARRFGASEVTATTAAVFPFALPMLTHIGATLNNDNLLALTGAVVMALLAGVVRGDRTPRTAALLGVATGLALLSKAFAVVFPPAIVAAYLVGSLGGAVEPPEASRTARSRQVLQRAVPPLALAGAVTAVASMWWYVGVRLRTGQFGPTAETAWYNESLQPPGFSPDLGFFAGEFARLLNDRFWGSFGWYSVRFPTWLTVTCLLLVVAAVATALAPARGEGRSTRLQRAVLLIPMAGLLAFIALRAWDVYATTSRLQRIQGRYLFAVVAGLGLVAAMGLVRWFGRRAPLVLGAFAAMLQLEAARRTLTDWWGGPGLGPRGQVQAMVAWSAWPGELLAALAIATAAALAWAIAELWGAGRLEDEDSMSGSETSEAPQLVSKAE